MTAVPCLLHKSVAVFFLLLLPLSIAAPTLQSSSTRSFSCPVVLPVEPPPSVSRTDVSPRIIGGDSSPSSSELFTLVLRSSLSEQSTRRLCTGARLSTTWGITAAHCEMDTTWTAVLPDGSVASIVEVHAHENYQTDTDRIYDIAVFRLEDGASDAERVVRVNERDERPVTGAFVRVLGFGSILSRNGENGEELRQVDIPVVPFEKCESAYESVANTGDMDSESQLCAGYMDAGGCDSCEGDSGGPVVQYNSEGKPILVAMVSAGRGCALPGYPGINLRVNKYVDWMKDKGAVFGTDDAPVQVVLDGGYSGEPPSGEPQAEKPSPPPSSEPSPPPSKAPAPPSPVPARPSPPPPVEDEPSVVDPPAQEPTDPEVPPTRTPRPNPRPPGKNPEPDEESANVGAPIPSVAPAVIEVQPGGSPVPSGEFPIVQDPSPSPSGSPTGQIVSPEITQVASSDTASPTPQSETDGNIAASNGAPDGASAEPKTASVQKDARIAGIVAGSIAGLIIVGGLVTLFIKLR